MSRYRFSLLAYPARYRAEHGDELVDTANLLAPHGWSARQSRSLLVEGLRTRARLDAGGSAGQAWASGIGLGAAIWFLVQLSGTFALLADELLGSTWTPGIGIGPSLFFGLVQLGAAWLLTRATGRGVAIGVTILGCSELAMTLAVLGVSSAPILLPDLAGIVVVGGLLWLAADRGDGRRALSPAAAVIVIVTIGAFALLLPFELWMTRASAGSVALALLGFGLLTVTVDPRPAIAATALWVIVVVKSVTVVAAFGGGLAALGIVVTIGVAGAMAGLALGRKGTRRLLTA